MADEPTWEGINFCTSDDILKRIHSVSGIVNVDFYNQRTKSNDSNAEDDLINRCIADTKTYIRKLLIRDAVPILRRYFPNAYADDLSVYISRLQGYQSADDIIIRLSNSEELNQFAICNTIANLYLYGNSVIALGLDSESRKEQRELWIAKAKEEYELAFPLLQFDLDSSGDIQVSTESLDFDGPYTFNRV